MAENNDHTTPTTGILLPANVEFFAEKVFVVGQLVQVAARTSPGFNQPGGVARITAVYHSILTDPSSLSSSSSSSNAKVVAPESSLLLHKNKEIDCSDALLGKHQDKSIWIDVKYVLDGRCEHRLLVAHDRNTNSISDANNDKENTKPMSDVVVSSVVDVRPYHQTTNRCLRNRLLLLGRCVRCGSLRRDCQSCDWINTDLPLSTSLAASVTLPRQQSESLPSRQESKNYCRRTLTSQSVLEDIDHEPMMDIQANEKRKRIVPSSDEDDDDNSHLFLDFPLFLTESSDDEITTACSDNSMDSNDEDGSVTSESNESDVDECSPFGLGDENFASDFIAPEGNASSLPANFRDWASAVPYLELPHFLDECFNKIEKELFPLYKAQVTILEMENRALHQENDQNQTLTSWSTIFNRWYVNACLTSP
jgi:hypothetical protein